MKNDMVCIPDSCSMLFPMIMLPHPTFHYTYRKEAQRQSVLIKCLDLSLFVLLKEKGFQIKGSVHLNCNKTYPLTHLSL